MDKIKQISLWAYIKENIVFREEEKQNKSDFPCLLCERMEMKRVAETAKHNSNLRDALTIFDYAPWHRV